MIVETCYEKNKNIIAVSLAGALLKSQSKPIFLCVGSDKVVGDSLGAIIGELLSKKYKINAHIYGDLDNNADANNIQEIVQEIKEKYPTSPVILIDGILGELGDVGQVKFYENGAYASGQFGRGVFVGNYSILAVVGVKGIDSLQFLSSVKLKTIVNQAEFIADSINRAFKYTQNLLNVF